MIQVWTSVAVALLATAMISACNEGTMQQRPLLACIDGQLYTVTNVNHTNQVTSTISQGDCNAN